MKKTLKDTYYSLRKDDKLWMDKEGKIWHIYEMDIWHVYHTVKMLERKNKVLEKNNFRKIDIPDLLLKRMKDFCKIFPQYCI